MSDYYVYGRNTTRECLHSHTALKLFTRPRFENDPLVKEARRMGVEILFREDKELDRLAGKGNHQGFVCLAKAPEMLSLRQLIAQAKAKENPLLLLLDGMEDPANLGAIIRSCDAFGVDGVVMKNNGNVTLNATVAKVSTGAIAYVPVASVSNLSQAISELKDSGYWIVASDGSATKNYDEVDYSGPIGIIVGSEGFGISKNVLQHSDFIVKIPMCGHVNSLNASVATGVLLSYISLNRKKN